MARQLRIYKSEDGEPEIKCPRCDELVQPLKNPIFDGFDCPECDQVIEEEALQNYIKALEELDSDEDY